jgi:uncharacterized membrane protein/uncharacterized protein YaaQ
MPDSEFVWSYRGYRLRSSEFVTAMVHYFRAEVTRANVWRQRLDTTTNWAVISTGASVTVAFSASGHHTVILLNALLITIYLWIEARRYRYYELWSSRIRLMETDFFASMLVPPFGPAPDWAESLAEHLLQPHFPISILEAIGRRYRRNYFWIFGLLLIAWFAKLWLSPLPALTFQEMLFRASIGSIPGGIVIGLFIGYNAFWVLVGLLTLGLQEASGEVLPRYAMGSESVWKSIANLTPGKQRAAWFRHGRPRQQFLAYIITDQAQAVADRVLEELKRGVTSLAGTGMFTGAAHTILMCALTVTEVGHLKAVVSEQDPNAFVIVTPAQEVLGRGFKPLGEQ